MVAIRFELLSIGAISPDSNRTLSVIPHFNRTSEHLIFDFKELSFRTAIQKHIIHIDGMILHVNRSHLLYKPIQSKIDPSSAWS